MRSDPKTVWVIVNYAETEQHLLGVYATYEKASADYAGAYGLFDEARLEEWSVL